MSVSRAVLLLSFVSLLLAAGLFFIGSKTGYEASKGGYAVLTVNASVEDRALYELLEKNADIFGGTPVSESTQWVMLDNFGSIETIPLDKYSSRLFSFDPRNDGYAGKLRDVFIQDDKRFIYIPLNKGNWNANLLDKQLQNILGDIPFSVESYGIGKPLRLFFIVYFAASLFMLIICYANKNALLGTAKIIPLIPVIASLSFFGAPGIASAAVIFGFFLLFGEPLNELSKMNEIIKNENAQILKSIHKNIIKPYRLYFSFIPVFAVAFGILIIFTPLKLLFLLLVFASSLALFFFTLKIMPVFLESRRRFNPVLIIKRRFPESSFSFCLLPFSAAVLIAVFSTPYVSGAYISDKKFDTIIYEQDYYAHLFYQTTFSTRQLGTSFASYSDYYYAEDGLPSQNNSNSQDIYPDIEIGDFPPFPLKNLMAFFIDVNNGERINNTGSTGGIAENLSLLVLLIFILPLFFVKRNNNNTQKDNLSYLNKLNEKKRLKAVNRNSSYVFSSKNTLRIRKDA
ncbi:MAG: hypothetical protein LBQ93_02930 [Treponema sp.]|jgi:hypothetical protein|nr:hypothetical protein [Treponema sp.]